MLHILFSALFSFTHDDLLSRSRASFGGSDGKESACQAGDSSSIPGLGRSPGEEKWQLTLVFLPGESQGQRSLAGYSPRGHKWSDMPERLSLPGLYVWRPRSVSWLQSVLLCACSCRGGPLPEGWAQRLCPVLPSQGCREQAGLPQQAVLLASEGCCPEGAQRGPGKLGEAGSLSPSIGTGWWGCARTRAGWGKWPRGKQGLGPQSSWRQGKKAPYPAAGGPWDVEVSVSDAVWVVWVRFLPASSPEEVEWSMSFRWRGLSLPAGIQSRPPSPLQNASMSQRGTSWPQMAPNQPGGAPSAARWCLGS